MTYTGLMKRSFSLKGCASRSDFIMIFVIYLALNIFIAILPEDRSASSSPANIIIIIAGLTWFAHIPALFTTSIRRLHDINKSGWAILLLLVPILNLILTLTLIFKSGVREGNYYSDENKYYNRQEDTQRNQTSYESPRSSLQHAANVLGLPNDLIFSEDEVRLKWRKVIERVHPDAGGTSHFAEQANSAKDVLLDWIKAGRPESPRFATNTAAPPRTQTAKRSRLGQTVFVAIGGIGVVIVLIVLVAGGALQHQKMVWELGSEKENDGRVLHLLGEQIVGDKQDGVRLYIGCFTSGIKPADDIRVFFGSTGDIKVESIKFRRLSESQTSDAMHGEGGFYIGALKSVDNMKGDDFSNAFGPAALVIFGKWLLSSPEDRNLSGDIVKAMRSYYNPALSEENMFFDVNYTVKGERKNDIKEIDFSPLAKRRSDLLRSCYLQDPYI